MLLLCAPKAYVTMPAKKPISLRPQAVKTAIHLQRTKINKNPFVTQRVFLHTLFLEYATETGGNKCKAVFYTYKQIGMRSLELFWPCSILAKNLEDVLARGLSICVNYVTKNMLFLIKSNPKFWN